MDALFKDLINFGALGVICGLALWEEFKTKERIFKMIDETIKNNSRAVENNSIAIAEFKEVIKKCRGE